MFETNLIIWMQQHSPAWLFELMSAVTQLGNGWIYAPLMLVLLFGVRLRPSMGVLLALVLAGFVVGSVKNGVALPRPADIDARVLDKGESGKHAFEDGAADSFWSLPSAAAIDAVRADADDSFGFISGHSANAMVAVLGVLVFFAVRSRRLWGLALSWPLLMAFSRMFLGRHFLADVIGGLVAGIVCVLVARTLVTPQPTRPGTLKTRGIWLAALCVSGTVLSVWIDWIEPAALGAILGTMICLIVLERLGYPDDNTSAPKRLGRIVVALVLSFGLGWLLDVVYESTGLPHRHIAVFVLSSLGFVVAILGSVAVCRRLRLYAAGDAGQLSTSKR